uniref:MAK10-like protein n=1 Tax=Tanacetum cinerariifolium TaxID=118510 RepID=A0A6L2ML65_TANCI|nr:MAK10-like protein [Tanacetum cinerariifolium]
MKVGTTQETLLKLVKAISLPQDVLSTSDFRVIKLKNQVERLMEARLAPNPTGQVNKIASSCEICSGPHDTQYCIENPKRAFVEYASSRTDEAGCKWYTFKLEQNNLGDTYKPSWKSHPNLRNSSFPKRVHFINSITILNIEDEPRDAWIVKPDTKNDDHDTNVKVEKDNKESKEEKREEVEDPEYINTTHHHHLIL